MFCGCGCVWFSLRKQGEKKGEAFCTVHTHKRSQPTSRHTFFMALAYWKPMKQWSPLMPFRRCLNALFQYARAISKFTNIDTHQFPGRFHRGACLLRTNIPYLDAAISLFIHILNDTLSYSLPEAVRWDFLYQFCEFPPKLEVFNFLTRPIRIF